MVRGAGSRKGKESDMYTFDSRVRYSETDEEGNLSVVGIMNYLQDCSDVPVGGSETRDFLSE